MSQNIKISGKSKSSYYTVSLLFAVLIITGFCYWPGLNGTYLLDDRINLEPINEFGGVTDFDSFRFFVFSNRSGTTGRPVSMLSFLINDQYFPGDPSFYKYTNLMIHLLVGLLLFLLLLEIFKTLKMPETQNQFLSLLVTGWWLLHPLNVSTTLYIIQRMTELMVLFSILAIYFYCRGRQTLLIDNKRGLIQLTSGFLVFLLLSILSKENGILTCLYILVLEFTIFSELPKPNSLKKWLLVFAALPLLILAGYLISQWGNILKEYSYRDFTMVERVLTESRILLQYLGAIVFPQTVGTGLFHDDIVVSSSLFSPFTTVISLILIVTLLWLAVKFRKKQPFFSLGILWFFGGHVLESTFIPLELYFEHRNYLPMVGPLIAVSYYILILLRHTQKLFIKRLITIVPITILLVSAALTFQSSLIWGHTPSLYKVSYKEHPTSLRASVMHAQMLELENNAQEAVKILDTVYKQYPNAIALPVLILNFTCKHGLEQIYSVDDIITASKNGEYIGLLPAVIPKLFDNHMQYQCFEGGTGAFLKLLTALESTKNLRGSGMAGILQLHADIHIFNRELSPAIETLDKAYLYAKQASIPVKQAKLLASAGLYKDAIRFLQIAKEADKQKRRFVPSDLPKIVYLEEIFKKELKRTELK